MVEVVKDPDLKWGDAEEDISEIQFPSRLETRPDNIGVKTVTEYYIKDGVKMKTMKTIKIVSKEKKVKKGVMDRRKWRKFGAAEHAGEGPEEGITEVDKQKVELHLKTHIKVKTVEKDDSLASLLTKDQILCRHCGKPHLSIKCPDRDRINMQELEERKAAPFGRRFDRNPLTPTRRDDPTVRISNLPPGTTERDVGDLVRNFGRTSRIYLARDYATNETKGFAFVSFEEKRAAENAIAALSGYGYGHLILIVEWAKPAS